MNNKEPKLKVGIMNSEKISFVLHDIYSTTNDDCFNGTCKASIIDDKIILKNGNNIIKTDRIILKATDNKSNTFSILDVVIGIDFHWERKENQTFKGDIELLIEEGKIWIINIVKVEDYLKSVISSEMSSTSSSELLNAHAIISRSWLLAQIEKSKHIKDISYKSEFSNKEEYIKWFDREDHNLFDVCADDHCQRYQGITRINTNKATEAVELTRGNVLWYNDKICDARFYKACGGMTEKFEDAWENVHHDYLINVHDCANKSNNLNLSDEKSARKWVETNPEAFCNTNDKEILTQVLNDYDQETNDFYRWQVNYSQSEISALIKKRSGIDFGEIVDLIPVERSESARLIKLKIVGTKKTLVVGKELIIRKYLSESHLYSSAFVIDKGEIYDNIPKSFTLKGAGWGHGVGLCQIGAAVMAAKKYKYSEILEHYFPNSELKKIY
jgi:SpoIID/LytB domain protein